jgi:hypothetical protein
MKHILLILSCCIAWTLQGAEDRIWVDVTINGQPVHMAFDTGSSISMLLQKTIDRLHLKLPNAKPEKNTTPGMFNSPAAEPCNFEFLGYPNVAPNVRADGKSHPLGVIDTPFSGDF